MILERVEIPLKAGQEGAFIDVMNSQGCALLAKADGCNSARIGRGVENPDKAILLLEWDSVDHHTAFTTTPEFDEFKKIAGPFFAGPTNMEHFDLS
jgi:heme-degrading monooxygenase HmoA